MTTKEKMTRVKALIQEKKYKEADEILKTIDDPRAVDYRKRLRAMAQKDRSQDTDTAATADTGSAIIVETGGGPGCLVEFLWFIFFGWYLTQIAIVIAWVFMLTIIGLPVGIMIINNLPRIVALRAPKQSIQVSVDASGNQVVSKGPGKKQRPFILRAIYFVLIGWWWTAIWLELAYILSLTVILWPISLPMFNRAPMMLTLQRY